jgi:hypothetical protein
MKNIDAAQTPTETAYLDPLAAAYIRGFRPAVPLPHDLAQRPLSTLTPAELQTIIAAGQVAGLRLHPFKRTMGLPRVSQVLGAFHSIRPSRLLDIGSGRGVFLWPLLDELPYLPVTAVDLLPHRLEVINAVRRGGIENLACARMDAVCLAFPNAAFDVVTMLEVLEHIPQTMPALAEVVRVAARFVILSVPSKPDNNPEHIHLFTQPQLRDLFAAVGIRRLKFSYVLNHLLVVASMAEKDGR